VSETKIKSLIMKTPANVFKQMLVNQSHQEALKQWFNKRRWLKVYPILTSQDEISLRVLEFLSDPAFIAECERLEIPLSYQIEYTDTTTGETHRRLFNLPEQLAATQYARRKKFMEPFARFNRDLPNGGRFEFGFAESRVETNVAQLQFMRFIIENNVLDWVRTHRDVIFEAKSRLEKAEKAQRLPKKRRLIEETAVFN
jgi:hypothetical protein